MTKSEIEIIIDKKLEIFKRQLNYFATLDVKNMITYYQVFKDKSNFLKTEIDELKKSYFVAQNKNVYEDKVEYTKVFKEDIVKIQEQIDLKISNLNEINFLIFKIETAFEIMKVDKTYDIVYNHLVLRKPLEKVAKELKVSLSTVNKSIKKGLDITKSVLFV